jgi:hypothetical protein
VLSVECLSLGKFAEHCRQGTFPSGLQEGWQPATTIIFKLALFFVSPDDGVVGDLKMWRFEDVEMC